MVSRDALQGTGWKWGGEPQPSSAGSVETPVAYAVTPSITEMNQWPAVLTLSHEPKQETPIFDFHLPILSLDPAQV